MMLRQVFKLKEIVKGSFPSIYVQTALKNKEFLLKIDREINVLETVTMEIFLLILIFSRPLKKWKKKKI